MAMAHFDRRGPNYDQDAAHHSIVSILLDGAKLAPGCRVLDVATGTGLLALRAAELAGPNGRVVGVDTSDGMLAEAGRKATAAGLHQVTFVNADAERLDFPHARFEHLFCASALVLMSDIPRVLARWRDLLEPGGLMAFDTPARPFGVSQVAAEVAAEHGVNLAYADIAETPEKCRALVEGAGLEVVTVTTRRANSAPMELGRAIAFWDEHLDHPAWQALARSGAATRGAIRRRYVARVTGAAVAGYVANDLALNFAFARRRREPPRREPPAAV